MFTDIFLRLRLCLEGLVHGLPGEPREIKLLVFDNENTLSILTILVFITQIPFNCLWDIMQGTLWLKTLWIIGLLKICNRPVLCFNFAVSLNLNFVSMPKNEKTSPRVAKLASQALRDPKASPREKSIAGSVLTQAPDRKKSPRKSK